MSVYVARIPQECSEKQLKDIFESVGPVKSVKIKSSKGDYQTNYAFIDFENDDDASCAAQYLNNFEVGDHKLLVNIKKKESLASGSDASGTGFSGCRWTGEKPTFGSNIARGRKTFDRQLESDVRPIDNDGRANKRLPSWPSTVKNEAGWDCDVEAKSEDAKVDAAKVKELVLEEKVLVIHVEHPSKFWGQPISEKNAKVLTSIASQLTQECKSAKQVTGNFVPGRVYGSKFSVDDEWYRCKIENQQFAHGVSKVGVRYIDYGNDEIVDSNSLVELPISLQQMPPCTKEYKLDINPVNDAKDSDEFRKGVEFLKNLINNEVVNVKCSDGINTCVDAFLVSSNKNVAKEMNASGLTIKPAMPKQDRVYRGAGSHALQQLRSPRSSQPVSNEIENLNMKISSLQSELQSSKLISEKMKLEVQMLVQKKTQLEESLSAAESKLKEASALSVHKKFLTLINEVSSLKKLRADIGLGEDLCPMLKSAVTTLTNIQHCVKLKSLTTYSELLKAEANLSSNQATIRSCSNKEDIAALINERDESRKEFHDKLVAFLDDVNCLNINQREQELQNLRTSVEESFELSSNMQEWDLSKAVATYDNWREAKLASFRKRQDDADDCSTLLTNIMEKFIQNLSMKEDSSFISDNDETIDDLMKKYATAIAVEIKEVEGADIHGRSKEIVSNVVSSIVHAIDKELSDIRTIREKLKVQYEKRKGDVEMWISHKPDLSKLKEIRVQLKDVRSKLRHIQADLRDLEEDSEDDERLNEVSAEIKMVRNELHHLFTEEKRHLGELSRISDAHFPELSILYPDFGISTFLESDGILQTRELEHYDHHLLPLLSSSSSQPLVFKTHFNQEDCVLKEFSLCPPLTKEVLKSRVFKFGKCRHPNFISLDSLFCDKAGRRAYLQTPYFEDGNFKDFIEKKPDSKALNKIFYDILLAVEVLHRNECVHGGIAAVNISMKKLEGDITAVLREPNFSKDETERFQDLEGWYPMLKAIKEPASKELDMLCLGLLMFSAYFPDQTRGAEIMKNTKEIVVYDVIQALLHDSPSERISARDAISHPIFQMEDEQPLHASPEELLDTSADPGDSFAIKDTSGSDKCEDAKDEKPFSEYFSEQPEEEERLPDHQSVTVLDELEINGNKVDHRGVELHVQN